MSRKTQHMRLEDKIFRKFAYEDKPQVDPSKDQKHLSKETQSTTSGRFVNFVKLYIL